MKKPWGFAHNYGDVPVLTHPHKWIKQNLTIKRLWGHSENAVKIHIWVAISTYLIVAYAKIQVASELSIYEIKQILSKSAFDRTPIRELLSEFHSNQNFKEQPNLFNDNFQRTSSILNR